MSRSRYDELNLEGKTLAGQYFLRKKIGSGGMADVYQAWDQLRSASVAVKILRDDKDITPERIQSFRKDAEWLEELAHPNIVRLYEMVHKDGLLFMVMDWVDGEDLRKKIDRQRAPFPPAEILRILKPVCTALQYTHRRNVFHCDIKPANILLARDGKVLLTDFGVARLATETREGGTPPYMSPEQIQGRPLDARTDIYSLGVTLYEMLSGGTLPFRGDSRESQSQGNTPRKRVEWEHCHLPIPPIQQYNPAASPQLVSVLMIAMHKDSARRYASVSDFMNALEIACSSGDIRTPIVPSDLLSTINETQLTKPLPPPVGPQPPHPLPEQPTIKASRRQILPAAPFLICINGASPGQVFPISQSPFLIGRNRDCQLVLEDPSVSRRHASIIIGKRNIYIQDENSKAGTYVNGQRIQAPVSLHTGSKIRIGFNWVFEFRKGGRGEMA